MMERNIPKRWEVPWEAFSGGNRRMMERNIPKRWEVPWEIISFFRREPPDDGKEHPQTMGSSLGAAIGIFAEILSPQAASGTRAAGACEGKPTQDRDSLLEDPIRRTSRRLAAGRREATPFWENPQPWQRSEMETVAILWNHPAITHLYWVIPVSRAPKYSTGKWDKEVE